MTDQLQLSPAPGQAPLPAPADSTTGLIPWLDANKWWLLLGLAVLAGILILVWLLRVEGKTKKLQRDALDKLRKSLIASCKATRGPARTIWITGSPRDPADKIGRYVGHHRSVEAVWLSYRTWVFGRPRLLAANPADLNALDVPEIHVRAIGVSITREIGFAVPDVHNPTQRADWQRATNTPLRSPDDFAEAWKAYFTRAIDNALSFYDSLNASEDRSFLRQEVTRSEDELTDTATVSVPKTNPNQEAEPTA
jgi:hypothetical protein